MVIDLPVVATVAIGLVGGVAAAARVRQVATRLPRRILAIGAHPDDIELACGGNLARLSDSGHEIHALVMSNGAQGGGAQGRRLRAVRAATMLGCSSVDVQSLPDTRLDSQILEMSSLIEGAVARHKPDIILTHSSHDQHQDHQAVHVATLRAARRHAAILCYESPSATTDFIPTLFFDISDHVDAKVAADRWWTGRRRQEERR